MQKVDSIKLFNTTPLIGLWGYFKIDKNNNEIFEVLGINNKMKEVLNEEDTLGKDIIDILGIEKEKVKLIYKNIKNEKEYTLEEYIPKLNKFYRFEIVNIYDDVFVVWLKPIYEFNKDIGNLLLELNCLTWIKDKKGRYIFTNVSNNAFYNLNKKDIVGKTDLEILPREIAEVFIKCDKKVLNKEVDHISELSFVNGNYYDSSIYPIYNGNEEIVGTIGFVKNITEKEDCKIESVPQKKMLELIGDNIPDNIFYKDFEGVFRYCNDAFARSNGLNKSDILGKTELELKSSNEKLVSRYIKEDETVYESKKGVIIESEEIRSDGSTEYRETVKVPFFDNNGFVGGILGISRDISHRKESEMEFERLRMEFFANLSHEFRTPLNLIFSSIQLLNLKLDKCDNCEKKGCANKKYRKYIDIINQNGFRLLKLVNNLIDSTRLDVGTLEYNPVNYDIVRFVENIFDSVTDFAKQRGIEIIFDTKKEEHIISFDLDQMERIILNLISNAIKFNKPDGKIEVNIDFDYEFTIIQVKDSGIGIPKDKLPEVFEKFKQVNNRMTKVSEGSGIGLSLVKSLAKLHNGSVEVESELSKYTKFIVKIPNILTKEDAYIDNKTHQFKNIENIQVEFSDIYLNLNT